MPTVALPPKVRAILYLVTFILGLVLSSVGAAYTVLEIGAYPSWYKVALAVLPLWTAAFGLTAASNVRITDEVPPPPHQGDDPVIP